MSGLLALFGAIVYLDTTAAFQFMVCQPIIACPVYGIIAGRPEVGLFFGLIFQLLWLRALPIGAARFPEGNLGALVATALATTIPPAPDGRTALVVLAVASLAGLLTAGLGRDLTASVRHLLKYLADSYQSAALEDRCNRARAIFFAAVLLNAAAGALFTVALYLIFLKAMEWLLGVSAHGSLPPHLAELTDSLWGGLRPALLGAGAGVVAGLFARRRTVGWIIGGFATAMGALLWL